LCKNLLHNNVKIFWSIWSWEKVCSVVAGGDFQEIPLPETHIGILGKSFWFYLVKLWVAGFCVASCF
jgi:hypothetical protein